MGYLIAHYEPSKSEVQATEEKNHGCDDGIANSDRKNKQIIRNALVVLEGARCPRLFELPFGLTLELPLDVEDDERNQSRELQSIPNE